SYTHSRFDRSVPLRERRKTTRESSGATVNERGAPREKRWVRACWRGDESSAVMGRAYDLTDRGKGMCEQGCAPVMLPCTAPCARTDRYDPLRIVGMTPVASICRPSDVSVKLEVSRRGTLDLTGGAAADHRHLARAEGRTEGRARRPVRAAGV